MKKIKGLTKFALVAGLSIPFLFGNHDSASAAAFKDVDSKHWAYQNVEKVASQKLVTGYQDGTFKPSNNVTRAEFATFLSRMFEGTDRKNEPFTDVNDTHWAKDAIEEGLALGFIQEVDFKNGKFEPNKAMTRQEIAKWLANGLKVTNGEYDTIANEIQNGKYTLLPVAEYYKGGLSKSEYGNVGLMLGTGIMSGFEDGSFKTSGNTTRAEVATILIRFGEAMKKKPTDFKGLNELIEVAKTGTNMLSATKFEYRKEDPFTNIIGKPHTFSRNNAGVATIEKMIFVEGDTPQKAMNSSIFAKMFIGKNTFFFEGDNGVVKVFTEMTFTSSRDKLSIDDYSNGSMSTFITNTGIQEKEKVKNYGLTTLDADNWGILFKKDQKVKYWTERFNEYEVGRHDGHTTDDGTRFSFRRN
ncbi:S-layer homology domain-containing protein [Lysinibacillus fusiformis]|uniref:S-layer homology domain-containing protein n=1 Tax=Lysinibacillus fusiformis TaxID=28031 RepID=UPI0023A942D5|nr:S-layer homology domain-containing protein [Lysinibacillus fusiformis]WEA41762.1 S-layer homology domain-containing protein [Lysinibacillus fusiformis]